jgi:site-specific DNA-methyltransferase (adenine-specific)
MPQPYYQHNNITLYHGDCLQVLAELPADSVDLVFTSPPYNLGNSTGGWIGSQKRMGHYNPDAPLGRRGGSKQSRWDGAALGQGYDDYNDSLPHAEYVAWQHQVLTACWRVVAPAGAIFYNHKPRIFSGRLITPFDYIPPALQPYIRQVVIWARGSGINCTPAFYLSSHEWIVIIARPAWRLRDQSASAVSDVWYIPPETNSRNPNHPAPFPVTLPARAIETTGACSILDPFSGRGTVLRAAKNAGIAGIGIDRNQGYCDVAVSWLQQEVLFAAGAA